MIWSSPLQITITFILLYYKIGYSVLAGLLAMIIIVPINAFFTNKFNKTQLEKLDIKDKRIRIINEILNGIKVGISFL
jgi:ATP-binding cassette, subfamily C (CFTR/MRP), member 1